MYVCIGMLCRSVGCLRKLLICMECPGMGKKAMRHPSHRALRTACAVKHKMLKRGCWTKLRQTRRTLRNPALGRKIKGWGLTVEWCTDLQRVETIFSCCRPYIKLSWRLKAEKWWIINICWSAVYEGHTKSSFALSVRQQLADLNRVTELTSPWIDLLIQVSCTV